MRPPARLIPGSPSPSPWPHQVFPLRCAFVSRRLGDKGASDLQAVFQCHPPCGVCKRKAELPGEATEHKQRRLACVEGQEPAPLAAQEVAEYQRLSEVTLECLHARVCPHEKREYSLSTCNSCPHGKLKRKHANCTGCPHAKLKSTCSTRNGYPHWN